MKQTSKNKIFDFFELYDRFIKESKSGHRLQRNGKKVVKGTLNNYVYTQKLLKNFCADKKFVLRLRSVKHLTQRGMIVEGNYWKRFYLKLTDYFYKDCGYFDNYVGQNIKIIRIFFGYCNQHLLLNIGDFYKKFYVRKEDVPIITLLPEELNYLIYDQQFECSLTKRFQEVKDVFVFGCTVALRFSDLMMLKKNNLQVLGDRQYLNVRSIKTATDSQICLPDYAVDILAKYSSSNTNFLLPRFNAVNLNLYLKELIRKAGFKHSVNKARNKRGVSKELTKINHQHQKEGYEFCDLITTHTMRRTAITTMLCLGMQEHLVRKISGHSATSKEFFRPCRC